MFLIAKNLALASQKLCDLSCLQLSTYAAIKRGAGEKQKIKLLGSWPHICRLKSIPVVVRTEKREADSTFAYLLMQW